MLDVPAEPGQLPVVRAEVARWAGGALTPEVLGSLQLVLGEAVANAVEHAYHGVRPGRVAARLALRDGAVHGDVRDTGTWRTTRDPGRGPGYGLRMIEGLAPGARVETGPGGTRVRFAVPVS